MVMVPWVRVTGTARWVCLNRLEERDGARSAVWEDTESGVRHAERAIGTGKEVELAIPEDHKESGENAAGSEEWREV
jgi:hypothetical protein